MKNTRIKMRDTIKQHIINNRKEYVIISLLFIIGIFLGVLFVNNVQEAKKIEITSYFNNFVEKLKSVENLEFNELLKTSIWQNTVLALTIWFFGTTVIGIPVVFGIVMYRGFCLGYTIATCISIMGIPKGLIFIFISILLQNIILIPAILALAVSGFKLYKPIVKDNRKENIKLEIARHTIFSIIMLLIMFVSSLIEIFVSTNLLKSLIKYF